MNQLRISVIMGIYNCAPTLSEALDSLLAQTYQDFKVIMCDDGSTDNTIEVAQKYVDNYPGMFILIRNDKNMGLNYTLNHCLEYADTEYVARMDGDDISLPERFEKEINFLDEHPEYAIVSTPMIHFDENGEYSRGSAGYEVRKEDFLPGPPFCHAPCMVRREAYDAVSGYSVAEKLMRVEDYHLWFKMYAAGFRGYMMKEPYYAMRDDRNARARRKFKYRVNSSRLRFEWFPKIGIKWTPYTLKCAISPMLIGLLPDFLYDYLRKKFHTKRK